MTWKKGNRLPMVTEAQAQGQTQVIYAALKEALGLPHVGIMFQVFGGYSAFLEILWRVFGPVTGSAQFFVLGERLRADAYTRMHNYFEVPDLCKQMTEQRFSEGARIELTEVADLFLYSNPLMLLISAALLQALEGPVGMPIASKDTAEHPVFTKRPVLVDEESAPIPIRKIYDEIKRTTGMPVVNSDLRAFARWPDFLRAYWDTLKATTESPIYHQATNGIRETAWQLARELPGPFELSVTMLEEAGVEEENISSIVRITDTFVQGLSKMTLNVALAKIGLEGGNLHREKPAPLETPKAEVTAGATARTSQPTHPTRAA